jgi:hypothetical protein
MPTSDQTKDKPLPSADDPFWTSPNPRSLYPEPNVHFDREHPPAAPWQRYAAVTILSAVGIVWVVRSLRGR